MSETTALKIHNMVSRFMKLANSQHIESHDLYVERNDLYVENRHMDKLSLFRFGWIHTIWQRDFCSPSVSVQYVGIRMKNFILVANEHLFAAMKMIVKMNMQTVMKCF